MERKNITFIIILIATIILGIVAVVTALKLREIGKEPVAPTAPQSKPKAQEPPPEPVVDPSCIQGFTVTEEQELVCDRVKMTPDDSRVEAGEERELEAIVRGGTPPYSYAWMVATTDADDNGSYSDDTSNPTTWTAPVSLTTDSHWRLNATITDSEENLTTCSTEVNFSTEPSPSPSPSPSATPSPSPSPSPGTSPSPSPSATSSPSPSPSPAPPPPSPELPEAGIISPTIFAGVAGIFLVILGILL